MFKTTKIQLLVGQIDYWSISLFKKENTLPDYKWVQTLTTTLDIKNKT
jgi:hypothetical protein